MSIPTKSRKGTAVGGANGSNKIFRAIAFEFSVSGVEKTVSHVCPCVVAVSWLSRAISHSRPILDGGCFMAKCGPDWDSVFDRDRRSHGAGSL